MPDQPFPEGLSVGDIFGAFDGVPHGLKGAETDSMNDVPLGALAGIGAVGNVSDAAKVAGFGALDVPLGAMTGFGALDVPLATKAGFGALDVPLGAMTGFGALEGTSIEKEIEALGAIGDIPLGPTATEFGTVGDLQTVAQAASFGTGEGLREITRATGFNATEDLSAIARTAGFGALEGVPVGKKMAALSAVEHISLDSAAAGVDVLGDILDATETAGFGALDVPLATKAGFGALDVPLGAMAGFGALEGISIEKDMAALSAIGDPPLDATVAGLATVGTLPRFNVLSGLFPPSKLATEYPPSPTEQSWLREKTSTILFQISLLAYQHSTNLKEKAEESKDKALELAGSNLVRAQVAYCIVVLDAAHRGLVQIPPEVKAFMWWYSVLSFLAGLDSDE